MHKPSSTRGNEYAEIDNTEQISKTMEEPDHQVDAYNINILYDVCNKSLLDGDGRDETNEYYDRGGQIVNNFDIQCNEYAEIDNNEEILKTMNEPDDQQFDEYNVNVLYESCNKSMLDGEGKGATNEYYDLGEPIVVESDFQCNEYEAII